MTYRHLSAALFCALIAFALMPAPASAAPGWLVNAIIKVESNGNPNAKGRHGEIGLMQIKLATARSVGYRGTRKALFHAATNVTFGTAYLNLAIKRAGGNLCHAATLYNRGVYAKPRRSAYAAKVMRAAGRRC